jgi:hypothetical protein
VGTFRRNKLVLKGALVAAAVFIAATTAARIMPMKPSLCTRAEVAAAKVYEGCLPLELNNATAGRMCDGVGASDRIQLVDQSTHMELGGVDRYAKTASYCLVGLPLGEKC